MPYHLKSGLKVFILIFIFGVTIGVFLWGSSPSPPLFSKPALTLLTYSSYGGVYGPARKLKTEFEKNCQCEVRLLLAEDSTRLVQRLQLKIPVDLVIGLDQISLTVAKQFSWKKHPISPETFISEVRVFQSPFFLPVDWSPIGWIYKGPSLKRIKNFSDMLSLQETISFPEPDTSTLGLQLYYWLYEEAGGDLITLKKLIKSIKKAAYGPMTSWSLAYGLFRRGRVGMSLSYLTSLAYHQLEEKDFSYRFVYFDRGHPWQVEFAAVPATCRQCSLSLRFMKFLMTPIAQKIIRDNHFMLPVISEMQSEGFSRLKIPKKISYESLPEFLKKKEELFKIWKQQN
ncbi:MAG: thiamine ABC transporter substrate-binding protein [Bdellovibrionales bacterium]|nr:thiamine ABC transporter substrate-binding protein [Bdellovibrionales bacterium]